MGGNYIGEQLFKDWKLVKIVQPIRSRNACIFIILLSNNKSQGQAVIYRYGKKHVFQFIYENRNLKQL